VRKSYANGNGPNGTGPNGTGLGNKPPEAAAGETTSWSLQGVVGPGSYAS
jgi:hypothetical protein